jgi:hypothetical protein
LLPTRYNVIAQNLRILFTKLFSRLHRPLIYSSIYGCIERHSMGKTNEFELDVFIVIVAVDVVQCTVHI